MSAFYTFYQACIIVFQNLYFVNNIIRECAKVLRGGAENFRTGAKSSQGRWAPAPPPPPQLRPCFNFLILTFDLFGQGSGLHETHTLFMTLMTG